LEPAHQRNLDKFVSNHYPDSPEHAMANWFAIGLYSGIRKSEWAQPNNPDWPLVNFQHED
jgi:hypothetical protein